MDDQKTLWALIDAVDRLALVFPEKSRINSLDLQTTAVAADALFKLVSDYRAENKKPAKKTRDTHVGESNYSYYAIQPWDVWIEYALNPWDADIVKRIARIKMIPGLTPKEARIQDYEKVQHICQERIDQINKGDPWYRNFKMPPWVDQD